MLGLKPIERIALLPLTYHISISTEIDKLWYEYLVLFFTSHIIEIYEYIVIIIFVQ
jgi:hypothetical protein